MATAIRTDTETINALRLAVHYAIHAPSIHNTQPWQFLLTRSGLDVSVDRRRRLDVLDPTGRQLFLSVGCALLNARVCLAARGVGVRVRYLPDPHRPDLVAHIDPRPGTRVDRALGELETQIVRRQTNRRRFREDEVPAAVLQTLVDAARAEGAFLVPVRGDDDRATLARLTQRADVLQILDPAYRAELREWTNGPDERRDGIPARVIPHVDGTADDDVPLRDFDTQGRGWLPAATHSSSRQCLVVLGTDGDDPQSWLQAGQALERVWLELTRAGLVASVFTQPIEVEPIRARMREELLLTMHPHVVLRIGAAAATPATSRRRIAEVLIDQTC